MEECKRLKKTIIIKIYIIFKPNNRLSTNLKRRIEAFQVVNARAAITTEKTATKITYYAFIEILRNKSNVYKRI
jgi:hypothetical protein